MNMENRRINVLQILEATTGGTRRHLYYLLNHLDKSRFSVSLIYSNERDPHFSADVGRFVESGITSFEIPMKREISLWRDLTAFFRICAIIRRGNYDVVHAHSSKAGFLGRFAAKLFSVPAIVYSPHSFAFQYCPEDIKGKAYLLLEKIAARRHHMLVCVSQGECQVAKKHSLCPDGKVCVIPNAAPLHEMRPLVGADVVRKFLCIPNGSLVVGMVAQFRPQKGIGDFIDAIPLILKRSPNTTFLIVGDGPLFSKMEHRITSLGVRDRVILAGYCENIVDYYQVMDVFVLSSLWEGMPYVVLEAMGMGLPVVATDSPGNNELVEHGRNGFLVQIGKKEDIACRVAEILEDNELRVSFGAESRRLAEARQSMSDWIRQYEDLYERLLRQRRRSAFDEPASGDK